MLPFYLVDVFAIEKYSGNQLAVFQGAEKLSTGEMQKIAREMNFSETTFIYSGEPDPEGYRVRIFTPEEEIPFAGHPTLGTAFVIREKIEKKPLERIYLKMEVGSIPVTFAKEMLWMEQNPPDFGETYEPEEIAGIVGLDPEEIDTRFPVQDVSTGLPFILIPLKDRETLNRASVDRTKYLKFIENKRAKSLVVFAPGASTVGNDMSVRVFADYYGVPEDPATGSANGCLAGYLVENRYWGNELVDIRVEQGMVIGRPSLLHLRGFRKGGIIKIEVGGRVVEVAQGNLV